MVPDLQISCTGLENDGCVIYRKLVPVMIAKLHQLVSSHIKPSVTQKIFDRGPLRLQSIIKQLNYICLNIKPSFHVHALL